jgi:hypothetical protein
MSFVRVSLVALLAFGAVSVVRAEEESAPKKEKAKAQPIDFRKLKDWTPAELGGIKRTSVEGQKTKIGDFTLSMATAEYDKAAAAAEAEKEEGTKDREKAGDGGSSDEGDAEPAGSPRMTLAVQDYAGSPEIAGAVAWSEIEIDQEGDDGYVRTTKIAGYPAFEQFQTAGKTGSLQVYVADRYIVTLNTSDVPADDFKKLGEKLPLKKLAGLK